MLLIAESGSTKCDWVGLNKMGEIQLQFTSAGLNPDILTKSQLIEELNQLHELTRLKTAIESVHFFGAGCGTDIPRRKLTNVLKSYFQDLKAIEVKEDMWAAALAIGQPGVVGILGTGSNSCFYDGSKIDQRLPALGYILMDEASGNYFGKELIRDYFYGKMPKLTARNFEQKYDLKPDSIKQRLFQGTFPNRYLASFAKFIFEEQNLSTPYAQNFLGKGFRLFIENHILSHPEVKNYPVHFVGSIAHYAKDIIERELATYQLKLGEVVSNPSEKLILHYQNKLKKK